MGGVMDTKVIMDEAIQALEATEENLPAMLAVISAFYPPAGAFLKFLPAIQQTIKGVDAIAQATGGTLEQSVSASVAHNTPGMANAPALGPTP